MDPGSALWAVRDDEAGWKGLARQLLLVQFDHSGHACPCCERPDRVEDSNEDGREKSESKTENACVSLDRQDDEPRGKGGAKAEDQGSDPPPLMREEWQKECESPKTTPDGP